MLIFIAKLFGVGITKEALVDVSVQVFAERFSREQKSTLNVCAGAQHLSFSAP